MSQAAELIESHRLIEDANGDRAGGASAVLTALADELERDILAHAVENRSASTWLAARLARAIENEWIAEAVAPLVAAGLGAAPNGGDRGLQSRQHWTDSVRAL